MTASTIVAGHGKAGRLVFCAYNTTTGQGEKLPLVAFTVTLAMARRRVDDAVTVVGT